MPIEIVTVPCLRDNYAYLVHDSDSGETLLVDAPEAAPIRAALDARGWRLGRILITHHHDDHIAGEEALRRGARRSATARWRPGSMTRQGTRSATWPITCRRRRRSSPATA